jgi:ABC-2 type transport system permease protein
MQVFMFTVIPAAAITYLPVELIREFNWTKLFVLIVVSLVFPIIAFWVFGRGLKRYESGNQMSLRI